VFEERPIGTIEAEQKHYLSKVTREAGYAFTGKVFGLLFGFVSQAIIARLLGADLLGVFVLAWTVVVGVTILTTLGFEFSLVRFVSKYASSGKKGEARSVFLLGARLTLAMSVVGTLAIIFFREQLAVGAFNEPRLSQALIWISLAVLPFSFMKTMSGALRGLKDVKGVTIAFEGSHRVLKFVLFLVFFYLGHRLLGIVFAQVFATLVSAVLLVYFLRRRGPFLFGGAPRSPVTIPRKDIVVYSGAMLADSSVAFAMQHSGRLVLGIFLASADVGVYNVAALVGSLITFVLLSFNMIFSPVVSDLFHRDRFDLLRPIFRSVTRWTIIFSLPIYAWVLAAGEVTLGVFGTEFIRGYAALALLGTGLMIAVSTGPVGVALAMTGHQKWNVYNAIAMAIIAIGLNFVLVPRMGIAGAGIAAGAAQALVKLARLIQVRFLLKMWPYDRSTLKVLATALVTVGLALLSRHYLHVPRGVEWSAAVFFVCVAVVALLTIALGIAEEDRLVLASVLKRLRRSRRGE
jgi:O-antigen/teichoic acid export membrane protein